MIGQPNAITTALGRFWRALRAITGDDAYERYLAHWHARHVSEGGLPLSRKAFYEAETQRRWSGVKRCC
ncbi:CstA-like transporter-associated (seleno)protein [Methylomagnum sp.]